MLHAAFYYFLIWLLYIFIIFSSVNNINDTIIISQVAWNVLSNTCNATEFLKLLQMQDGQCRNKILIVKDCKTNIEKDLVKNEDFFEDIKYDFLNMKNRFVFV